MSYDNLRGYSIPKMDLYSNSSAYNTCQEHQYPPSELVDYYESTYKDYRSAPCSSSTYPSEPTPTYKDYNVSDRFVAPGARGYQQSKTALPQKRKFDKGPSGLKKKTFVVAETTDDGKPAIFQGRDESYPDALNFLIHPLTCSLCDTNLNSIQSARFHYESKAHDRNITKWLNENYTNKGLEAPIVKRFLKDGPSGPAAMYCELCDLKLTSIINANQHYSGRKHQLVANKISKPSGSGFYNNEGKWVRTGSKANPTHNDGSFGIGLAFKQENTAEITDAQSATVEGDKNTQKLTTATDSMTCTICKITVTSPSQMAMHVSGAKHVRKLKLSQENGITDSKNGTTSNTILASFTDKNANGTADLSMYRTPTGSYYCKICNITMCQINALEDHLEGKKHIKKVADAKDKPSSDGN